MKTFSFMYGKYHIEAFVQSDTVCPFVYCMMDAASVRALAESLAGERLVLFAVSGMDWAAELSPWPAPRAFRGGEDFGGGGEAYLRIVEQEIMPEAERQIGFPPSCRVAAGYSLAGLWVLYAAYRSKCFSRMVCVSGSLWYDGFLRFMKETPLPCPPEKVYFSLGRKEKMTKNQRMAVVETCMREAESFLQKKGTRTIFEENPGGHFQEPAERLARGIRWILPA